MRSFEAIVEHCESQSSFSKKLIDKYLIYYAAERGLEKKMNQQLKRYQHVVKTLPDHIVNVFKSEYLCGQIFCQDGLIGKYLYQAEIKALPREEYEFLAYQKEHPWRFSFAIIVDRPAENFFTMLDVFREEEYLLYSPGMSQTLAEKSVHLWFNLIADNGQCWQTYGSIVGFSGFTSDDIFFFAGEVKQDLEDEEDLIREVERNPWPFFMLFASSMIPFTVSQGVRLAYYLGEDELASFPYDQLKRTFEIRWNEEVYELQAKGYAGPPHFAKAYYDENEQTWLRVALTEEGFTHLTRMLRQNGVQLDPEPLVAVSPGMLLATQEILRRKIALDPYEELFDLPEAEQETDKLNHLLQLALPYLNHDTPLDIEKIAAEAGVDIDLARELLEKAQARIRKLRGGK